MTTGLPIDLQKLPPQALDVIRYLGRIEGGAAPIDDIMAFTGLSERVCRKSIRRLVTRFYVEMPDVDYYMLTTSGHEAAATLRAYDGEEKMAPAPPAAVEPAAAPVVYHARRLSAFLPKELVERSTAQLRVGFDPPANASISLTKPARVILRLNAPNCDIQPVERPLEVPPGRPAGPAAFRLTPRQSGTVRVKIQVFQLVTLQELVPAGGMFFDLNVSDFPTPASAEFQALAITIRLHPGKAQ